MKETKIFLIGDCHFGHRNIIRYCNRPFKDVEDMTEKLIANWNSVVSNNGIVYVVGFSVLMEGNSLTGIHQTGREEHGVGLVHHKADIDGLQAVGF